MIPREPFIKMVLFSGLWILSQCVAKLIFENAGTSEFMLTLVKYLPTSKTSVKPSELMMSKIR